MLNMGVGVEVVRDGEVVPPEADEKAKHQMEVATCLQAMANALQNRPPHVVTPALINMLGHVIEKHLDDYGRKLCRNDLQELLVLIDSKQGESDAV